MGVSLKLAALLLFASLSVCSGSTPAGEAFLATKATEDGVITHSSGLMYKVLADGPADGKRPLVSTPCECHYKGTTITGEEFDSSYSRGVPTTFAPNQVIKGWTIAMQLMKEGDKVRGGGLKEGSFGRAGCGHSLAPSRLVGALYPLRARLRGQPARVRAPAVQVQHTHMR
jgi:FKBP-type peptidyl-prolyl cis-trans isomerase FklB